jgi:hypothetical protein
MTHASFPAELGRLRSRGSASTKPGSLAALHKKRKETLSQYFTPAWLSKFIWETVSPAFLGDQRYSVFDNSIGAAAMFRQACPKKVHIYGIDADADLVSNVINIFENSEYRFDILHAHMENVELERFSAALVNPPYSIPLYSPFLKAYPGITHYGKHGPNSSALSQEYALAQALSHCDIVAAVVPQSTKDVITRIDEFNSRLRAVFELPANTFKNENVASVKTVLLIFGRPLHGAKANATEAVRIQRAAIDESSAPVTLYQLECRSMEDIGHSRHPIKVLGIEQSKPVVILPVTVNKTVLLKRAGRRIKLSFFDEATEARVKNALFRKCLYSDHSHKYPKQTRYDGQFKLNLDVIAMQDDPFAALDSVCDIIKGAGGDPVITAQLKAGLKNIVDENRKMLVPFGRTVYRKGAPDFNATSKRMGLINRTQKGAAIAMNESVTVKRVETGFLVLTKRGQFTCEHDAFFSLFEPENGVLDDGYWEEIFPPITKTFPSEIAALMAKATRLGINQWLTWDYQIEDLCELAFKPTGGICGWQMALGKSRLAISLALLLTGKSLIVLKSRLVSEMVSELNELGITDYRVIRNESDIEYLGKINIISYERLKQPISPKRPKVTLAKLLRKKVPNVLCDEGGLLANNLSQQTRAIWQLGAKRKYILDGTPCPNYPRECLNLGAWAVGEERAYQPYSMRRGFIEARLFNGAEHQPTGRDEFNRRYVSLEWSTNEFLDTGVGAKREVPKIKAGFLQDYRNWLSPIIKRRVQQEPAVSRHVKFPVPELRDPVEIDWSFDHLLLYVKTVEEFANWYRDYAKERGEEGKSLNLTMILARLEACFKAANVPSMVSGYGRGFQQLTTKEMACLDLIESEVKRGLRPIVFARNPVVLERLSAELDKRGITNLVFTGKETIKKRIEKLNSRIRQGCDQVMLASLGVTQDGLNLPQLNSFIFYNRSYSLREEFQAIYRLIRPQQRSQVSGTFLHLKGSIDEYMAQLQNWKSLANEAGLDYGEQADNEEFIHFDAFIYKFINSLPELKEKLDSLKKMAAAA